VGTHGLALLRTISCSTRQVNAHTACVTEVRHFTPKSTRSTPRAHFFNRYLYLVRDNLVRRPFTFRLDFWRAQFPRTRWAIVCFSCWACAMWVADAA